MWLFTRYGFFSVACARQEGGRSTQPDANLLMIRARQRRHLECLQQRFSELAAEIATDGDADYTYRIFVPKAVWTRVVAELAEEQTWTHFKREAARFLGADHADYIDALHRVWGVMHELQGAERTPSMRSVVEDAPDPALSGAMIFVGVDLGWHGKPTGLAVLVWDGAALRLRSTARLVGIDSIVKWIEEEVGAMPSLVAVDAPLIIRNANGARPVDRQITSAFGRYDAGCHSANLTRPFAALTNSFSSALALLGYEHAAAISPRKPGRFQIEIHPHTATVQLFELERIVKYKKGRLAQRAAELARYRQLIMERLPGADPPLVIDSLPRPRSDSEQQLKAVEDRLDAVIAAYTGAHWWSWGAARNAVYGDEQTGYIVVPARAAAARV